MPDDLAEYLEVKEYALWLNTADLVPGSSVERIEQNAIDNVTGSIYLPASLVFIGNLLTDRTYFYEGSLQELRNIQTRTYNKTVTLGEYFSSMGTDAYEWYRFYLNADKIGDRSKYWR